MAEVKRIWVLCLLILCILIVGCNESELAGNKNGQDQLPADAVFMAQLEEKDASLYGLNELDGKYNKIAVKAGEKTQLFDWNTDAPSASIYAPSFEAADLTGNGHDELLIALPRGRGGGVHLDELHILDAQKLEEYNYLDPLDYVEKHVDSTVKADGYEINADDKSLSVWIDFAGMGLTREKLYGKITFGDVIRYSFADDKFKAVLPGQVSPAHFVGQLVLTYEFEDSQFEVVDCCFIPEKI